MSSAITIRNETLRARAIDLIGKLNLERPWTVTIARHKSKRSIDQNSLYWKWLTIIADDTGNSANDIHEWCRSEFIPPVIVTVNGNAREVRPSTTKLDTKQMTDYLNRIEAWAATELGVILPSPDDLGRAA